jgi:hypothetical protein
VVIAEAVITTWEVCGPVWDHIVGVLLYRRVNVVGLTQVRNFVERTRWRVVDRLRVVVEWAGGSVLARRIVKLGDPVVGDWRISDGLRAQRE